MNELIDIMIGAFSALGNNKEARMSHLIEMLRLLKNIVDTITTQIAVLTQEQQNAFNPTSIPISRVPACDVYIPNGGGNGDDTIVDFINGDDATGERNNTGLPFKTFAAAKAVLQSGDQCWIKNGIFDESDILVEGVIFYFSPKTGIHCTAADPHLAIINSGNTGGSGGTDISFARVLGHGTFENDNGKGGGGFPGGIMEIDFSGTDLQFQAAEVIDHAGDDFIDVDECTRLLIRVDKVTSDSIDNPTIYIPGIGISARFESVNFSKVSGNASEFIFKADSQTEVVSFNGDIGNDLQPVYGDLPIGVKVDGISIVGNGVTIPLMATAAGGFNPIEVDAAANFAAGVLTLPAGTDTHNVIILTTAAGSNITSIAGAIPSTSTFQIKCAAAIVNTLETSLIAGAVAPAAGSIISNAGNFVINGDHLDNVTLQLDSTMIVHVADSINI